MTRGVEGDGLAQGAGGGLEEGLDNVVCVAAVAQVQVQRDAAVHGEGAEEVLGQFDVEVADPWCAAARR